MDILITYDIADTAGKGGRRLKRISQVCERYGERVQFSVFECRLSPTRMTRMIGEVQDVIDKELDSVIIYRLPKGFEDSRLRFGRQQEHEVGRPWIL